MRKASLQCSSALDGTLSRHVTILRHVLYLCLLQSIKETESPIYKFPTPNQKGGRGGLEIHQTRQNNLTLLTNFTWPPWKILDSSWVQLLKQRYYPQIGSLEAPQCSTGSFSQKNMVHQIVFQVTNLINDSYI